MPDEEPTPPTYELGAVANGHVLTAAGWIPLRRLPDDARQPYYPGDTLRGHAFTGNGWVAIPEPPPRNRPSTGPSLDRPRKNSWLLWVAGGVAVLVILGIVGAIADSQSDDTKSEASSTDTTSAASTPAPKAPRTTAVPNPTKTTAAHPDRVVMDGMWIHSGFRCEYNGYTSTVTGTITNQSGRTKSYVQVSFGLYDASGALLGTAYANVTNLAAGTDWKYDAVGAVAKFATCKAEEVDAY